MTPIRRQQRVHPLCQLTVVQFIWEMGGNIEVNIVEGERRSISGGNVRREIYVDWPYEEEATN